MATHHDLRLHEETLLLALKDEKGTPAGSMYSYAMAGAILTELLLEGRVRAVPRRRGKPLLEPADSAMIGEPVLDDALRRIREARRRATLATWVSRLARRAMVQATAERLARKGVLRAEEKRVMVLFSRTVYPELDPAPERRLIERIRSAVLGDGPVDERTAAAVALAHAAGLLRPLFDRKVLKARKVRLAEISEGAVAAEAAREAIQAVQSAVIAATTAATAAST
jgi:Golgi phosphoprotein 3